MPNLIRKLTGKIGLKLLQLGGVGRITPFFNHQSQDGNLLGNLYMSDYHYISHPVSQENNSARIPT